MNSSVDRNTNSTFVPTSPALTSAISRNAPSIVAYSSTTWIVRFAAEGRPFASKIRNEAPNTAEAARDDQKILKQQREHGRRLARGVGEHQRHHRRVLNRADRKSTGSRGRQRASLSACAVVLPYVRKDSVRVADEGRQRGRHVLRRQRGGMITQWMLFFSVISLSARKSARTQRRRRRRFSARCR